MFPYEPNFNPQKQKPAISVCGPRQLIVISQKAAVTTLCTLWGDRKQQTELLKREKKWLVPVSTYKVNELYILE
jgi:hypothetical protein